MWGPIAVSMKFSHSVRERKLYNINETDAADIKAIHTANCKAVCYARPTVMADEDNRDIANRYTGRCALYFCLESREHGGANG
jgi:hypothetical protein